MIRFRLNEYRRAKGAACRDRLLIVHLTSRGRPYQEIAADLDVTPAPSSDGSSDAGWVRSLIAGVGLRSGAAG
jgi:hypothetical protein